MRMVKTEAWVLRQGNENPGPAELEREEFSFPDVTEYEVLAEPIYGCWEANMTHALERSPIDICRERSEERVVIGNAGVVRVLKTGPSVTTVREGDLCLVFCNGVWNALGYPKKIFAYDAPHTVGVLAKRMKLHEKQAIRIPKNTPYSLQQWAAFSLRYITAWANWQAAYGCWQLQLMEEDTAVPFVWAWGGGVSLAELTLAKFVNCAAVMISSSAARLEIIQGLGIRPIDRRQFLNLNFDEKSYHSDQAYKEAYQRAEKIFLDIVGENTNGSGVSIFIDYIGSPVFRATLRALGCPGVVTTAGWKGGMRLSTIRAIECMSWHIHVHTHYARYLQGLAAVHFAEQNGWVPPVNGEVYSWDRIPQLAKDYAAGRLSTYFPIFQINLL